MKREQNNHKRPSVKKIVVWTLAAIVAIFGVSYASMCGSGGSYYEEDGNYKRVTEENSYNYLINHPVFAGFGQNILPWKDNFLAFITGPLRVSFLMPKLVTTADTSKVIEGLNYLIDYENETGNQLFYNYYSEEEMATDASKTDTGLVFLKGEEGGPFALVCPGGAYVNVEANHEGYPVAEVLHKQGYNVFVLRYRVEGSYEIEGSTAEGGGHHDDAGKALSFIIENAESFGVSTENYSLWGFSAGGDVAGTLANPNGEYGYARYVDSAPAAVILGYPVPSEQSAESAPLYIAMAKDDALIDFNSVKDWGESVQSMGVEVTFDVYETGGHGFGNGSGKPEDGWMDKAIAFWESNMSSS